jgi:hypothetical protein
MFIDEAFILLNTSICCSGTTFSDDAEGGIFPTNAYHLQEMTK